MILWEEINEIIYYVNLWVGMRKMVFIVHIFIETSKMYNEMINNSVHVFVIEY